MWPHWEPLDESFKGVEIYFNEESSSVIRELDVIFWGNEFLTLNVFQEKVIDSLWGENRIRTDLYVVKETFRKCFFDLSNGVNVYIALNAFVLVFTLIYYIKSIFANKIYKKPARLCAVVILTPMLGVGAAALAFKGGGVWSDYACMDAIHLTEAEYQPDEAAEEYSSQIYPRFEKLCNLLAEL